MKKAISILLAAILIVSVCCTSIGTAFAADVPSGRQSARDLLGEFIAQAETVLTDRIFVLPERERAALEDALKAANAVYKNEDATDQELMDAAQALFAAAESPIVRNSLLQAKHVYTNTLELIGFALTPEQAAVFEAAIALADELSVRETLTIQDAQELEDQIAEIANRVEAPGNFTKEDLGILIDKTTPFKEHPEHYTEASYVLFETAYKEAADVYAAPAPSQDRLDEVFFNLASQAGALLEDPDAPVYGTYGDVNRDGQITVADALMLQKALAMVLALDAGQQKFGDVDASGSISVNDVLLIQQYIAKAIDRFPAEKPADIEDTPVDDIPFA